MNPDFQFPTSLLRDMPCEVGINEQNDHKYYDYNKGVDAIIAASLRKKRVVEEEGVEQCKR